MKICIKQILRSINSIACVLLIVLIFALHFLFFYYIIENFQNPNTRYFRILLGAVGFTGTMAGLSLRLSSCSLDKNLKYEFYSSGKWLTFCAVLFIVAIGLQYTHSLMGIPEDTINIPKIFATSVEDAEKISNLTKKGLYFIGIPLFIYGLLISLYSLSRLTWLIRKEIK